MNCMFHGFPSPSYLPTLLININFSLLISRMCDRHLCSERRLISQKSSYTVESRCESFICLKRHALGSGSTISNIIVKV